MSFYVGQKVICIDNLCRSGIPIPGYNYVSLNTVYTVRDIFQNPYDGRTLLRLTEIKNPPFPSGIEPGFDATRFRPITERKTDISIFKRMLTPSELKKAKRELV